MCVLSFRYTKRDPGVRVFERERDRDEYSSTDDDDVMQVIPLEAAWSLLAAVL